VDERNELVDEIDAGSSLDEALALLEVHMGFSAEYMSEIVKTTPIGDIHILRDKLSHIVEKRADARERYVKFALDTLVNPYEIWETMYDDGMVRLTCPQS
ncbi:TPA: PBECR2 nuclease fold domain-containing protein, partial [Enterobacter roggenkampii]